MVPLSVTSLGENTAQAQMLYNMLSRPGSVPAQAPPRTPTPANGGNDWIAGSEHPCVWRGRFALKNDEVLAQMFHLSGHLDLFRACMDVLASGDAGASSGLDALLKISQRMRFDPSQMEGVYRKLRQPQDFVMCLALATAPPSLGPESEETHAQRHAQMNRVMSDSFIRYLQEKSAAGIIHVCSATTNENLYIVHIFPPCDFTRSQLGGAFTDVHEKLNKTDTPYLLVVITNV
ncbi:hypothetical protein Ciccas_004734 [Cichlidogyrus casuarinus]|uniref:SPOC domain-containing protein n=1 Tax=Cichlidogyrus casuarinus TaxID=1844966 RepID=A0ABD2QCY8_9PLAT